MSPPFLHRYVYERRFGWRLLWRFLPNVLGPFYSEEPKDSNPASEPSDA